MESLQNITKKLNEMIVQDGQKCTLTLEESLINECYTNMWDRASRNHNGEGGMREEAFAAIPGVSLLGPSIGCGGSRGNLKRDTQRWEALETSVRVSKLVKLSCSSW